MHELDELTIESKRCLISGKSGILFNLKGSEATEVASGAHVHTDHGVQITVLLHYTKDSCWSLFSYWLQRQRS